MKKLTIKLFTVLILLNLSIGCTLKQRRYFVSSIPFDEKQWKINDAEMRWQVRPGMARDLINRNLLIGKNCDEINELLNIYKYQSCDKNFIEFGLREFYGAWIYGFDPTSREVLRIYFDENEKVVNAEIKFYES